MKRFIITALMFTVFQSLWAQDINIPNVFILVQDSVSYDSALAGKIAAYTAKIDTLTKKYINNEVAGYYHTLAADTVFEKPQATGDYPLQKFSYELHTEGFDFSERKMGNTMPVTDIVTQFGVLLQHHLRAFFYEGYGMAEVNREEGYDRLAYLNGRGLEYPGRYRMVISKLQFYKKDSLKVDYRIFDVGANKLARDTSVTFPGAHTAENLVDVFSQAARHIAFAAAEIVSESTPSFIQLRKEQLFKPLADHQTQVQYLDGDTTLLKKLTYSLVFNADSTKFIGFYNEERKDAMLSETSYPVFIVSGIKYDDKWYHSADELTMGMRLYSNRLLKSVVYQHLLFNGFYQKLSTNRNDEFWDTYPAFGSFMRTQESYAAERGAYIDSLRILVEQPPASSQGYDKQVRFSRIREINDYDAQITVNRWYQCLPAIVAWGRKAERKQWKLKQIAGLKQELNETEKAYEVGDFYYRDVLIVSQDSSLFVLPFNSALSNKLEFIFYTKTELGTYNKYKIRMDNFEEVLQRYRWSPYYETFYTPDFWDYLLTKENGTYTYIAPID